MPRALLVVLVVLAVAAPAHAATELSAVFRAVALKAQAVEVEHVDWFPIRGVVDFGEADARFGAWRGGRAHEGQDVFAEAGAPLVAMRAGRVVEIGNDGGRGNYVAIWSDEAKLTYVYLHMRAPTPHREGAELRAGERVGAVGCTGSCFGDHLHVELRHGRGTTGEPIDPMPALRRLVRRAR